MRKNEKNPILKEEERILAVLKSLKNDNKISESLFLKMKPIGSQPARLYGLAKIHKPDVQQDQCYRCRVRRIIR